MQLEIVISGNKGRMRAKIFGGKLQVSVAPPLVRRFVAGTEFVDVLPHMKSLAADGIRTTINILGENYATESQERGVHQKYLDLVTKMNGADTYLSIKLSMLGLAHSEELAAELLHSLLQTAEQRGVFVRIDMEGSAYTEKTIAIYEKAKKKFANVGIVLQAYLKRTADDLARLWRVDAKVRLCKGAYRESPAISFQNVSDIRKNYMRLADTLLKDFSNTAFATHDDQLLTYIKDQTTRREIKRDSYEFQMLYGMRRKTWSQLREQDYNIRVYIPFGKNWFPYFSRRLLERKENMFFLLRNLIRR